MSVIPFLDLVSQHLELEEDLVSVFRSALEKAGFVGGPAVEDFEPAFADFCHVRHAIGVGRGTHALRFAVKAAGVQAGDTVLTVPNTFIATTEAISQAGARFDFVDIDPHTYTMDPVKLAEYLETRCTRGAGARGLVSTRTGSPVTAVVPVHLYGQMADMDPILELAARFQLLVVEDACQAHGATYFSRSRFRWFRAGSMGHAAAFSFYPGKNLGACGEAGAITTDDDWIARQARMLRDHGQSAKNLHDIEGYNGRLDAVQAGILSVKLRRLETWNEQRRERARAYDTLFNDVRTGVTLPHTPRWSKPVHHLYVVRVPDREGLQKHLAAAGIATGIHYPIPLHLTRAYEGRGYRASDFPIAEQAAREVLSLPMYPTLSAESQRRVVTEIADGLSLTPAVA